MFLKIDRSAWKREEYFHHYLSMVHLFCKSTEWNFYTVAKKFNAWQVNLYTSEIEGEHLHKIMIVEDDKALLNGITLALKCADMEVVPCHNIKSAQTRLAGVNFDLVILDINLPDGNGLDLLRELKKTSAMPVIMLTANDMETDIVAGLEMGADDYITKPFSLAV